MTDQFKELVSTILSQNPNLPVEQLLSMVEKKKQESHGLLSDEGAIRLLAQQLSINTIPVQSIGDQSISSLQAGLMDASIGGTILSASGFSEFTRQDRTSGKVLRVRLADSSGQVTCVAWDDIADFINKHTIGVGYRVRLEHGYTKYGKGGETEFHLGSRSTIQVLSKPDFTAENAGQIKVSGLSRVRGGLSTIKLRIRALQPPRTPNGPAQALCEDETGLAIVKFWDDTSEMVTGIGEGETIQVEKPYAAERNGIVYVNVGRTSSVIRSNEASVGSSATAPIGTLNLDPILRVITGRIVERSDMKEIETRGGRKARVSNIRIEDKTGSIRVSLWDKHAEFVDSVRLGDNVELAGVKVRRGFMDQLEASTVFLSQLTKK